MKEGPLPYTPPPPPNGFSPFQIRGGGTMIVILVARFVNDAPFTRLSFPLLSNVERVSHVSAIQFHYSWSGNAAFAVLFKENGWNQRLARIYSLGWVG